VVPPAEGVKARGPEEGETGAGSPANSGLLAFILQGILWGAVSLVTPCVFPMIPITVSFFLKQSEKQQRPLLLAAVYCGTIVVVLTGSAVALLSFFTAVSTHPLTNFGMGALFIFFALSLFGMYDIELPRGLAAFTSKNEGKGGLVGTMFMALTFTIISFACVAPFLGGFGGTAAMGGGLPWSHRIAGGLAFATAFASPFFFLALFPTLLKTLPKSGTWLNSVKVVMGFLELAAAVKFLRAGELLVSALYHNTPTFFTYDLCLGMYVALAFACGLYLLNVYRLPHDTPINNLGVPRLLLSIAFLSLGLYLMPALFKLNAQGDTQRPGGVVFAWLDSFLLPELGGNGPAVASGKDDKAGGNAELAWREDLQAGLKEANVKHGLVFVDFSGINCPNCRLNERGVFPRPDVKDAMSRYTLVRLITDYDANKELEAKRFDTISLPHYVILRPMSDKDGNATGDFETVSEYAEGAINNVAGFVKFLKDPLGTQTADARTPGE
jgi:thiol:disulfide interchange protein DsbD